MASRWGVTEWRNKSVSRHEDREGWLGTRRHDPGDTEGNWRDEPTREEWAATEPRDDHKQAT